MGNVLVSIFILVVIAVFIFSAANRPSSSNSFVGTTTTSTISSRDTGSAVSTGYEDCVSAWTGTTTTNVWDDSFADFGCYLIQSACDEYRSFQNSLSEIDNDVKMGYAIPSDATEVIKEFTSTGTFSFPGHVNDSFATTSRDLRAAYRTLRIAYLKEHVERIDSALKQIDPLKIRMDSMCKRVPPTEKIEN